MEYVIPVLVGSVLAVFVYVLYEVYQIMKIDLGFNLDEDDD